MALDTGRRRLESLERRGGGRALWGKTWSTQASHNRATSRRRGGLGMGSGLVIVLAGALFATFWYREPLGVAPVVDRWSANLRGLVGYACADLESRYDNAVSSLGGALEEGNRRALASAVTGCQTQATTLGERGRACIAASGAFARVFDRRQSLRLAAARVAPEGAVIGASASGILGSDDVAAEEALARSLLDDCRR